MGVVLNYSIFLLFIGSTCLGHGQSPTEATLQVGANEQSPAILHAAAIDYLNCGDPQNADRMFRRFQMTGGSDIRLEAKILAAGSEIELAAEILMAKIANDASPADWSLIGHWFSLADRKIESARAFERAWNRSGDPAHQMRAAESWHAAKRWNHVLRVLPDSGASPLRVDALIALGRGAEAVEEVQGLMRTSPTNRKLKQLEIDALAAAGRKEEALSAATILLEDLNALPTRRRQTPLMIAFHRELETRVTQLRDR